MNRIPDQSINMILCDLPYGVTNCKWDTVIPLEQLWQQYRRIIKENGVIILTAIQPFTTTIIQSNRKWFRYCWYWKKNMPTGFPFAKVQPMRCIEDIVIFYKRMPKYHPQGLIRLENPIEKKRPRKSCGIYRDESLMRPHKVEYTNYPKNLLEMKSERGLHPTQKPVQLFEYLIRTYTDIGETVLDNCMGSGTTAIACIRSGRNYVGFEQDEGYYKIACDRVRSEIES